MKVRLRFFGTLALTHGSEIEMELKNGTTWGEAVDYIFQRYGLGKINYKKGTSVMAPGYLLLYLNGREQRPEALINEGDEIIITHPLVGG